MVLKKQIQMAVNQFEHFGVNKNTVVRQFKRQKIKTYLEIFRNSKIN